MRQVRSVKKHCSTQLQKIIDKIKGCRNDSTAFILIRKFKLHDVNISVTGDQVTNSTLDHLLFLQYRIFIKIFNRKAHLKIIPVYISYNFWVILSNLRSL